MSDYYKSTTKRCGMFKKARAPINTYTDFWNKPTRTKKNQMPVAHPVIADNQEVAQPEARGPHNAGYISSEGSRFKESVFVIKVVDKQGNVKWIRKANKINGKQVRRYAAPITSSRQKRDIQYKTNQETFKKEPVIEPRYDPINKNSDEARKIRKELSFDYTKKRHYGRFTRNPHTKRDIIKLPEE